MYSGEKLWKFAHEVIMPKQNVTSNASNKVKNKFLAKANFLGLPDFIGLACLGICGVNGGNFVFGVRFL